MLIDRRTILASGLATLMPRLAQAQAQVPATDPSIKWPIDNGQWCSIPDFAPIVAGTPPLPKIVCGWRPERRVNDVACVRLESNTANLGKTIIHNYGHCGSGITLGLGCASLAESWLAARPNITKDSRITIVGAGMIGLAIAYVLKRRGYKKIRIVARAVASGDFEQARTVSDIAGGQFDAAGVSDISGDIVPGASGSARLRAVLRETLNVLTELRGETADPFLTNGFTNQYVYTVVRNYTVNPNDIPDALKQASGVVMENPKLRDWMVRNYGAWLLPPDAKGVVAPFQELQRFRAEPIRFGARNTILINTANLIGNIKRYLRSTATGPRCEIISGNNSTIRSFAELQAIDADVIFNCTGLGGAVTGGDDPNASMTGRYGLLAKLPRIKSSFGPGAPRYLYSGFGYMFPRSDGTVIGGAWDDSASWGLPRQGVAEILQQPLAAQEVYFNSLLSPGALDAARAQDMLRALGYFFLGRPDDLLTLKAKIDWFSNAGNIDCAANRAQCG